MSDADVCEDYDNIIVWAVREEKDIKIYCWVFSLGILFRIQ